MRISSQLWPKLEFFAAAIPLYILSTDVPAVPGPGTSPKFCRMKHNFIGMRDAGAHAMAITRHGPHGPAALQWLGGIDKTLSFSTPCVPDRARARFLSRLGPTATAPDECSPPFSR
ncbi:hypothetical protein BD414DRAFT_25819 [Trametes punicea]|nr:hypothetical protein BD414DRAFT_25819 [Trametes punicea]